MAREGLKIRASFKARDDVISWCEDLTTGEHTVTASRGCSSTASFLVTDKPGEVITFLAEYRGYPDDECNQLIAWLAGRCRLR